MSPELRQLLQLLGRHKGRYALGVAALACADIGQLAIPYVIGRTIDGLTAGSLGPSGLRDLALAVLACALFTALSRYVWRIYVFGTARQVERELRERLFAHLQRLDAHFYLKRKVGDLMAHSTNDVHTVRGAAGEGVMAGADAVLMASFAALMMGATVDWRLAGLALAPMALLPVFSYFNGSAVHGASRQVQAAFSDLTDRANEGITGIRVVKGFAREGRQRDRFAAANEAYRGAYARLMVFQSAFDPVIHLLATASFAVGLGLGGHMVASGALSLGQYVAFNTFLARMIWPMMALGWVVNIVQRATASMGRLQALFDERPAVADAPGALAPVPAGVLRVENLSFRYPEAERETLSGVSFVAAPGRVVGILGGTGSGKSTLANLLVRVFDPPRGAILLDDLDVLGWELSRLRQAVASVPQDGFLFSRTIRENLAFAPGEHPEPTLLEAAGRAQLASEIEQFPDGYDTELGERGITLSGGQRQRLAIARALVKDAPVLVLDDSLSAVDTATEAALLEALRPVFAERAVVLISNRVSTLRHADEILVLESGRVIERGAPAELLAQQGLYARLYRRQQLEASLENL